MITHWLFSCDFLLVIFDNMVYKWLVLSKILLRFHSASIFYYLSRQHINSLFYFTSKSCLLYFHLTANVQNHILVSGFYFKQIHHVREIIIFLFFIFFNLLRYSKTYELYLSFVRWYSKTYEKCVFIVFNLGDHEQHQILGDLCVGCSFIEASVPTISNI
jgi:hypothetical protein